MRIVRDYKTNLCKRKSSIKSCITQHTVPVISSVSAHTLPTETYEKDNVKLNNVGKKDIMRHYISSVIMATLLLALKGIQTFY